MTRLVVAVAVELDRQPVFWPLLLYVRARAFAHGGRPADARQLIDESIELSGGAGPLAPLFFALKGDLLRALPERDGAEQWFQRGFDQSAELNARSPQLRAAIGLCRLRPEHGRALLSTTYATFTEGFTTPDLIEAKELLT